VGIYLQQIEVEKGKGNWAPPRRRKPSSVDDVVVVLLPIRACFLPFERERVREL
jgi:hypothetical protein